MSRVPWLWYDSKGFQIGPYCRDCQFFIPERPFLDNVFIGTCPYCCHIWSDGIRRTCSSSYGCSHFIMKSLNLPFFDDQEIIGEQLTLFD